MASSCLRMGVRPSGGDQFFVHVAFVEITDLAADVVRGVFDGVFDDRTNVFAGFIVQTREGSVIGLVRRNVGGQQPAAVDVQKQVVLGADGFVETIRIKTRMRLVGVKRRRCQSKQTAEKPRKKARHELVREMR